MLVLRDLGVSLAAGVELVVKLRYGCFGLVRRLTGEDILDEKVDLVIGRGSHIARRYAVCTCLSTARGYVRLSRLMAETERVL